MLKTGRLDKPYKGIIDCTTRTYRAEGFLAFWRDQIKALFKPKKTDSYGWKFGKNIASGGAAGAMSLMLANDAKSGSKGGERQFNGIVDVYRKTLKSDGIAGLYRGFVISCVGIIVYRGFYFGLYDTLKPMLLGEDAGLLMSFVLGYGVTVSAGLASYPIDTIRRRNDDDLRRSRQVQGLHRLHSPDSQERGFHVNDEGSGS
ncbi:hypothetical protein OS493_033569 [Desmophyllum pertusum]|uniref:ADP/ATP translocase n=1 Tax=Desmophyllum pertusum TaxID=174260 RepID=A0A9W9YYZ9_9CNID|nr:hypothetical protein OS493_033569 [Desmophyllum pertusum]